MGGPGADTIDGQGDTDTALYDERSAGEPVTVPLASVGDDGAPGENDTLLGIENVTGGAGNDVLGGDDGPNVLSGNAGNDTVNGLDGADTLHGGDGRDIIAGDLGSDMLFGDGGDDSLLAFDGVADALDCGDGADDDAQVDGLDRADNCEFRRRLDVLPPADLDSDGVIEGTDCNDRDAAIRPGAPDPPADGIDQNCDGRTARCRSSSPACGSALTGRRGAARRSPCSRSTSSPAGSQARDHLPHDRAVPAPLPVQPCHATAGAHRDAQADEPAQAAHAAGRHAHRADDQRAELVSKVRRYTVRRTSAPRRRTSAWPGGEDAGRLPARRSRLGGRDVIGCDRAPVVGEHGIAS